MSYRLRLGSLNKKIKEQYDGKTYEQIVMEFANGDPDNIIFASIEQFKEIEYMPVLFYPSQSNWKHFYSFDLKKQVGQEFYILSKEDLKEIIGVISKEVHKMYSDLFEKIKDNPEDRNVIGRLYGMLMSKKDDWDDQFYNTLNLKEDNLCVTESGSFEYMVFNLISIYKGFDWENDYLIMSGW